jgi:hypothetical protein
MHVPIIMEVEKRAGQTPQELWRRPHMTRLAIVALAALGILLGAAPFASAATSCTSRMSNKTINDDLVVPAGKTCDLHDVAVLGNVYVEHDANLEAEVLEQGRDEIFGSLIAVQCAAITWGSSVSVGGNVEIKGCKSNQSISGAFVSGNFACVADENLCELGNSTVGGNAQFNDNGGGTLNGDSIAGNLQCHGNADGVTVSHTFVTGNKGDQCASDTPAGQ